jgi:8-oxo-dGTP diphosphatase
MPEIKVGVGIAIETANGYILMRRQGSHGAGEWSLPGGKVEFGETIIECAIRETFEETGLTLLNPKIIPIFTEDFFPEKQFVTLYVFGTAEGEPCLMEPNKASEIIILAPTEPLPSPTFCGLPKIWDWIRSELCIP